MSIEGLSRERLLSLLARFPESRITIVGDFFLDKYLLIDPSLGEPSLETGKLAHQVTKVRTSPGAAGTVAANLAALEAGALYAVGYAGDDGEGYELKQGLERLGCCLEHFHTSSTRRTPTYIKPRDVNCSTLAGERSRYDIKNWEATPKPVEQLILGSLEEVLPISDAVVVMDQVGEENCGTVTSHVRGRLCEYTEQFRDKVFWVDSRHFITLFRGFILKANQFEVTGVPAGSDVKIPMEDVRRAVSALRVRNGAPIVVTMGALGVAVSDPDWSLVPGIPVRGEIDPTGAGDSLTAGAVLALCAGASLPEAAMVGNLVASITVQHIGDTGTASRKQLVDRLERWKAVRSEMGSQL